MKDPNEPLADNQTATLADLIGRLVTATLALTRQVVTVDDACETAVLSKQVCERHLGQQPRSFAEGRARLAHILRWALAELEAVD